jgi:hypothetical protein
MVDKIDVAERFMYLDCVRIAARQGLSSLSRLAGVIEPTSMSKSMFESFIDAAAGTAIDWDQVLCMGNSWYDRLVGAFRKPTRAERRQALDKIDDDIRKLAAATKDWQSVGLSMLGGPRNAVSRQVGNVFVALLLPAVSKAIEAEDRGAMQFELIRLAFALAAYHADHGAYPAKLADLAPKYVAEVPKDIFNASELHYRQEGGGYLLYSVGVNGKDDGGKGYDDRKKGEDWDDLAVRVPPATAQKQ